MVGRRQLAQALEVGSLPGQDMIFVDGPQRRRSERQVHRVAFFVLKIDGEARKHRVDRSDAAKAPAPVNAKAAFRELYQSFDMLAFQLTCRRHFLEFFSHNKYLSARVPGGEWHY